MGFFLAVVQTERMVFAARFDPCPPLVTLRVEMNALEAGRIVSLLASVCLVLAALTLAQITKAVVASIAIDVVHVFVRPSAEHIQPDQPVSLMQDTIDADYNVSATFDVYTPGRSSALASALEPAEMTRLGIVGKKFLQSVLGYGHIRPPRQGNNT